MQRLSSKMTFYYKRIFPVIWFGFLILFIGLPLFQSLFGNGTILAVPFLIMPLIMIAVGYFIMNKLIFDLVDEA